MIVTYNSLYKVAVRLAGLRKLPMEVSYGDMNFGSVNC